MAFKLIITENQYFMQIYANHFLNYSKVITTYEIALILLEIDILVLSDRVLDSHNIWNAESDIHMMEDLTGGIVDRAQIMEITWDYLWISFNNNWPMTCMRRVCDTWQLWKIFCWK